MGRTPLTLATLSSLAVAALAGLVVAVPTALGAPARASVTAAHHAKSKQKPQRCRATRQHRCAKKPARKRKPKPKPKSPPR